MDEMNMTLLQLENFALEWHWYHHVRVPTTSAV